METYFMTKTLISIHFRPNDLLTAKYYLWYEVEKLPPAIKTLEELILIP